MRHAHWVQCDPPSEKVRAGLVQLCELVTADEDDLGVAEIFVDPSGLFALSCLNGEWSTADLRCRRRDD